MHMCFKTNWPLLFLIEYFMTYIGSLHVVIVFCEFSLEKCENNQLFLIFSEKK